MSKLTKLKEESEAGYTEAVLRPPGVMVCAVCASKLGYYDDDEGNNVMLLRVGRTVATPVRYYVLEDGEWLYPCCSGTCADIFALNPIAYE